jgi:hypothetical protein
LTDGLFQQIREYDPRVEQVRAHEDRYAKLKNLVKLIKGIRYEDLKQQNYPLAELFAYVSDAIKLKRVARDERKKAEAAAAAAAAKAKAKADREKAKADAAAAKARAAAAPAGGDDGDEDPEDG